MNFVTVSRGTTRVKPSLDTRYVVAFLGSCISTILLRCSACAVLTNIVKMTALAPGKTSSYTNGASP
jgi:hypothetical protein